MVMGRGQKPTMVTVETRQKTYPVRKDACDNVIDEGGVGTEIAKERQACPKCDVPKSVVFICSYS